MRTYPTTCPHCGAEHQVGIRPPKDGVCCDRPECLTRHNELARARRSAPRRPRAPRTPISVDGGGWAAWGAANGIQPTQEV